jgi:hypothetical protein
VLSELFEELNLNNLLNREPYGLGHPLFKHEWEWDIFLLGAGDQEVHFLNVVLDSFNDAKLHKSESKLGQEDLLVTDEETTLHPSVNSHTDLLSKVDNTLLVIVVKLCLFDSLEEESLEGLERVLVHVIHNTKLDKQKVKGGTFSSYTSVDLTKIVNGDFSLFGLDLLALNFG